MIQKVLLAAFLLGPMYMWLSCNAHRMFIHEPYPGKDDEIVIRDYIAVSQFKHSHQDVWKNDAGVGDSLFTLFFQSFSKLGLNVDKQENSNKITVHDQKKHGGKSIWFNTEDIDTSQILNMFSAGDKITMVPVITIENQYAMGSERFESMLNLGVFMIRRNKVIYFNTCTYFDNCRSIITNMHINYENYAERPRHTRKDWDDLVRDVMKPYLDKLK